MDRVEVSHEVVVEVSEQSDGHEFAQLEHGLRIAEFLEEQRSLDPLSQFVYDHLL